MAFKKAKMTNKEMKKIGIKMSERIEYALAIILAIVIPLFMFYLFLDISIILAIVIPLFMFYLYLSVVTYLKNSIEMKGGKTNDDNKNRV